MSIKTKPVSNGFQAAARGQTPRAKAAKPDIKTKTEQKTLEGRRSKPAVTMEPKSPSAYLRALKTKSDNELNKRIATIKASHKDARQTLLKGLKQTGLRKSQRSRENRHSKLAKSWDRSR